MGDLIASSWSGGKDSAFACYQAMKAGYRVQYLVNFINREYRRACFHGIKDDVLLAQADRAGIPMKQEEVSPDLSLYEEEFKAAIGKLKEDGIDKMVFGDIYLDEHKDWVERVTGEMGIEAMEPLWGRPTEEILNEFITEGFKAIVVSAQAKLFDTSIIGRLIDHDFVLEMKEKKVCPCGENGEFHTLLIDAPFFKKPLEITKSAPITREGYARYHFMDIREYE